ncbi:MAG: PAS domain-containing protein [Candidatus Thorarchaeota archaeon]
MRNNAEVIPNEIREHLRKNPKGMTITELASKIDINRNSMARYLDVLQISGQVEMRKVGSAKMYFLSQRIPLEAMLDLSGDGILTYDAQLNIIRINDSFGRLIGLHRNNLLGHAMDELRIPGFANDQVLDYMKDAVSGNYNSFEAEIKNGSLTSYIRMKFIPTTFEDGSAGGTVILEDVTERKQYEDELEHQRDFLNLVMESVAHPFYVIDARDYTIQMANKAARLGSIREDSTCYSLTHKRSTPCSGDVHPCPLREVKETRKPAVVEHIHHQVSGKTRHVEIHAHPIFGEDGNVVQVVEYNLDVTERKELEEDLRRLLSMYQLLVEQMGEKMFVTQDEVVVFCNSPFASMLGYDVHEITGVNIGRILSPAMMKLIQSEGGRIEWQPLKLKGKSGQSQSVEARIVKSEYMGSPVKVICVR